MSTKTKLKRKGISQTLRFEVFKRDHFTCQYCGQKAPDIVLCVDHINPVKEGGDNNIFNLITSCYDCNSGKGIRKLTDRQEVQKQQEQLMLLAERKEQLVLLLQWRTELEEIDNYQINIVINEIQKYTKALELSETGRYRIKQLIHEFSLNSVLEAIEIAYTRYYKKDKEKTFNLAFEKIGGICFNTKRNENDPIYSFRSKAYNVFKNKFSVHNEDKLREAIKSFVNNKETYDEFYTIVNTSRNYSDFFRKIAIISENTVDEAV